MSDPYATRNQARGLEQTRVIERAPLYLPLSQTALNPIAATTAFISVMGMPWAVQVLKFYCTVYVVAPNTGVAFWTVTVTDSAGTVIASFTTAAIAAATYTRFAVTPAAQPLASSPFLGISVATSGTPGAIYVWPSIAILRTDN